MRGRIGLRRRDVAGVATIVIALIAAAVLTESDWLNIAGVVAAVIGLAIAVGQIRLAQDQIKAADQQIRDALDVARATQQAVTTTRDRVAKSLLIEAIVRLKEVERKLYSAVHESRPVGEVGAALAEWRDGAYDAVALVKYVKVPRAVRNSLIDTAKGASSLRNVLDDADAAKRKAQTAQIRSDISEACGLLSSATTQLKLETGEN